MAPAGGESRRKTLDLAVEVLINPQNQQIEIYRPDQSVEISDCPSAIDCGEVMPGFSLNLRRIW